MKALVWIGDSRKAIQSFPQDAKDKTGRALRLAQRGGKSDAAKPLQGFGGASVLEIVADADTDTYRAIYTVQFVDAIYVLHCFQKKSKRGSAMTQLDKGLLRRRLAEARARSSNRV